MIYIELSPVIREKNLASSKFTISTLPHPGDLIKRMSHNNIYYGFSFLIFSYILIHNHQIRMKIEG